MQLTDDEIRAILIREKKKKRRRKRIIRRITALVILLLIIILGVGLFTHRDAFNAPFVGRGIIFIDPGHGGADPGSEALGRAEKDDTLTLALEVKKNLEDLDYKVVMSRSDDSTVEREDRGAIANEAEAQLFISIHRNQATEGDGVEVWIPSSNSKEAQLLGQNILDAMEKQGFYARGVHPGTLLDPNDDYYENSVPEMPSCIVETGFVSSKKDNKLYDSKLQENAKALADAIDKTFIALYEE